MTGLISKTSERSSD